MNEGGSYVETCQIMRDRHRKAPAIPSWLIVDQQYMRKYMLCGTIPRTRARRRLLATAFVRKAPQIEAPEGKIGARSDTSRVGKESSGNCKSRWCSVNQKK